MVVVLVSNLLLFIAVLTINILSEWYPSIINYRVWLLWCIPCLTTCYMIYLKEIQIGEHWIDIHNPFKVVWWTIFIINLFILTFISFNIMDVWCSRYILDLVLIWDMLYFIRSKSNIINFRPGTFSISIDFYYPYHFSFLTKLIS